MRRTFPPLLLTLLALLAACDAPPSQAPESTSPTAPAGPPVAEAPEPAREPEAPAFTRENIVGEEAYGPLQTGLTEAEVTAAFGPLESTDEEVLQEATGEYIISWDYPTQGVRVDFLRVEGSTPADRRVGSYGITAPSELKSRLGIGIGSSADEVRAAYGELIDEEGLSDETRFIAGSIYGGEIFGFEGGVVRSIFVGAAAE